MSTARSTRTVFPGTVRGSGDLAMTPNPRPGTVYIDKDYGDEGVEAAVRIIGTQITAVILRPDPYTEHRRIILRDLLGEVTVQVDTFVNPDLSLLSTVAIAEGMVRGLALSLGVELVAGPETSER